MALSPEGHPEQHWPHQYEQGAMKYRKQLNDMFSKNTSIFLSGCLQSWRYFHHRENELKSQFVFNKTLQKDVDTFLHAAAQAWRSLRAKKIKENYFVETVSPSSTVPHFIGLHVRRGDFIEEYFSSLGYKAT